MSKKNESASPTKDDPYAGMSDFERGFRERGPDPGIDCQAAIEAGDHCHTIQSAKDECDINKIMERYARTGLLQVDGRTPHWGIDVTNAPKDLETAYAAVMRAEELFAALPAVVRRRFGDDPVQFCDFANDPANVDELRKMGLAKPEAPVAPPAGGGSQPPSSGGSSSPPVGG